VITKVRKSLFDAARAIQEESDRIFLPPQNIVPARRNDVLVAALFENTRGYLEKVVYQINKCYGGNCYDACAVMIRRLIEILLIETFDAKGLIGKTKDKGGYTLGLDDLITTAINEPRLGLSKKTEAILGSKKIKLLGDLSAHSRRYNACRKEVDEIRQDLSVVVQDLLYLSGLMK
jgi:hypothetical protein